jgi:sporulation protein YlmC with PRC-barrel domain
VRFWARLEALTSGERKECIMRRGEWIELGREVYSSDGRKLGNVDRLVLNSENQHLEQLVVGEGFLSTGKLIDIDLVDRVEGDRVVLTLPTAQVEQLPDFVATQFVDAPAEAWAGYPGPMPAAYGGGGFLYAGPLYGAGYPTHAGSIFGDTIAPNEIVENVRNIPEQDIVVDAGSEVVAADGKKVGSVDRVLYGQDGAIEGVVVKAGFLFKHDVTIPGNLVAELDDDQIRLSVPADEVRA